MKISIITESEQVVTALEREKACKMSDILLLELERDIKEKKETLLFLLLKTRMKEISSASSTSTAISILEENVGTESEP